MTMPRFNAGRLFRIVLLPLLLLASACRTVTPPPATGELYQVSTLNALLEGVYDGTRTCGELKTHGTLGIGTFDGLDGELVLLDGRIFQVAGTGRVREVPDATTVPFACVIPFTGERQEALATMQDLDALKKELDRLRPNPNAFCAIRIDGTFVRVKTRSVPRQTKPYPKLVEVTKNQPVFESQNVSGTLVGFWCPAFAQGFNLPGYHLHFLSADRTAGGHLLDCRLEAGIVQMEQATGIRVSFPAGEGFGNARLDGDRSRDLHAAEQ